MRLIGTSTQRTYRYVRVAIVGAVVLLLVSLAAVVVSDGPVTSISAMYYTPARGVFTGALFAIALALIALSGHSVEQALLDVAALFAPLIAIVPTPILAGDVAGYAVTCPTPGPCVPAGELPAVQNGMLSLAVVGALGVMTALVLARVQGTLSTGVAVTLVVAAAIVVGTAAWALLGPASFVALGHLVATGAFFGIVAVVSTIAAITSAAPWRGIYRVVAIGIAVVLVGLVVVLALRLGGMDLVAVTGIPLVLLGELAVVVLFAVYWVAQTVQFWDDANPAILR